MTRESNTSERLLGATWSGSMFVAVGTGATIVVSSDGINWEEVESSLQPPNTDDTLRDVVWTGSQFAAVGQINSMPGILLSPDGMSWHSASNPPSFNAQLYDLVMAENELLAVGSHMMVARSEDGEEWAASHWGDGSHVFLGVAWSGTEFLAVGHRDGEHAYYGFGELGTWGASDAPLDFIILVDAAWAGSDFVIIGKQDYPFDDRQAAILTFPYICFSSFNMRASEIADQLNAVWWDGITTLAVGDAGSIFTSEDLDNWAIRDSGTDANLYGIASSNDMIVVVGDNGLIITSQ